MTTLASLLLLASSTHPVEPAEYSLLASCSKTAQVLAKLHRDAALRVSSALSQAGGTCYSVTASLDGRPVHGYVFDEELAAIAEFRGQITDLSQRTRPAPPAPPASSPEKTAAEAAPKYFEDFSVRDVAGQPLSLRRQKGKVILVQFWSAASHRSRTEADNVVNLYNQFHERGLAVVSISMDRNVEKTIEYANQHDMVWPQYADGLGPQNKLARKYQVESDSQTFVLDSDLKILAAGVNGDVLWKAVEKLFVP